jgi:hypothetical protein
LPSTRTPRMSSIVLMGCGRQVCRRVEPWPAFRTFPAAIESKSLRASR